MRHLGYRTLTLISALLLLLRLEPVEAQGLAIGGHGGANVSTSRATRLLGLELAWQFDDHFRLRGIGTTEVDQPTRAYFLSPVLEWQPTAGWLRPYIGAGGTVASFSNGWSSSNRAGWLVLGGIEAATRIGTPYLELRVHGVGGTREHIVVGFRLAP
jgi:hypothetical protein